MANEMSKGKGLASLLVAKHNKENFGDQIESDDEKSGEASSPRYEMNAGHHAASEDMVAAIHARDHVKYAKALKNFLDCSDHGSGTHYEEEDEE